MARSIKFIGSDQSLLKYLIKCRDTVTDISEDRVCELIDLKTDLDLGCAPNETVDLTAGDVLPTVLPGDFSQYNLVVTTDTITSINSAAFSNFAANLAKPTQNATYNVWNIGTGTISTAHPILSGAELTARQGDMICLKCCNGAWQVSL